MVLEAFPITIAAKRPSEPRHQDNHRRHPTYGFESGGSISCGPAVYTDRDAIINNPNLSTRAEQACAFLGFQQPKGVFTDRGPRGRCPRH